MTEAGGNRVRAVTPAGLVSTLAGGGGGGGGGLGLGGGGGSCRGLADGFGAAARFSYPTGVAVDAAGVVFVADTYNHRIRRIENGLVSTLAGGGGDGGGGGAAGGFADGARGAAARFDGPRGLALDPLSGLLIVADANNNRLRAVDARSGAASTLAGSGAEGDADGAGEGAGEGGEDGEGGAPAAAALAASFRGPQGVAVDAAGDVVVADSGNHRVRRLARGALGL